jgi:hypothetical protein
MKPAVSHHGTRPHRTLLTAFTRGASLIALCAAGFFGHATAKSMSASAILDLHVSSHMREIGKNVQNVSKERLNTILRNFKSSTLLEQAALSWPPQFAIGQTWTINTVGVGTWTLPLTTTKDGDAVGAAIGTDKREGWFRYYPKNGADSDFILNVMRGDNEIYFCAILPDRNPSGNTLNGTAYRTKSGSTQPEELKTSCSATLGSSSSQTTTPTSPFVNPNVPLNPNTNQAQVSGASPVWPPKPGEAWTMTVDGLAPWAINFDKLDKDGDPTGTATQSGVKSTAFAYLDNGEYVFEITDGKVVTDCVFTKLQVQGNAFVGGKAYSGVANSNSIPSLNKACSAALGGGQAVTQIQPQAQVGNQTPTWPPKPNENWTLVIDGLAPWLINFDRLDKDGDPVGTATQSGVKFEALAYKDKDGYEFELSDDTTVYFCTFSSLQVQGNAFIGGKAYAGPKSANSVPSLKKSCSAAIGSSASTSSQAPNLSWPPKIAIGQTWDFAIQGGGLWTVTLEKTSAIAGAFSGSVKGTDARNNGIIGYDTKNDYAIAAVYGSTDTWLCLAEKSGFSGSSITGNTYRAVGTASPTKTDSKCTLSLSGAPSANAGGSTLGGIFGNANTNNNSNTSTGLSWPVQVSPGQTWAVNVKNIAFQLKLERVNNGITIGTATSSSGELAGGFATQGDNLNLILTDGTATILCTFGRSSVQGQTLNGQAIYTEKPNAAEQSWGACSATLGPKASNNSDPLNLKRNNLLESQVAMLRHFSSW